MYSKRQDRRISEKISLADEPQGRALNDTSEIGDSNC